MTGALRGVPPSPFSQPAAIEVRRIDPVTGLLAPPGAPAGLDEVFLPGSAPTEVAPAAGEQNPDTFIMEGGDGEQGQGDPGEAPDPSLAPPQ